MQLDPRYDDVVRDVSQFLQKRLQLCASLGIASDRVVLDPGIGFGKMLMHNIELLKNVARLRAHDRPLVVGLSRKSFLGKLAGTGERSERVAPTLALTALLRGRGADIFRVHDVKENVAALRVAEAILS